MTQQEVEKRVIEAAAGKRKHDFYQRTVELAKKYRAYSTGEGLNDMMRIYARRESPALFAQRCDITQHITTSVISGLFSVLKKSERAHYRKELNFGDGEGADAQRADFEKFLKAYASKGTDKYVFDALVRLNQTDPNAWVVQDWKVFDNLKQRAEPYPIEYSSAEAVDFYFDRGELIYLTIHQKFPDKKEAVTCYQKGTSFKLTFDGQTTTDRPDSDIIDGDTVNAGGKVWTYQSYYHGLASVPAFRAGYAEDLATNGKTFVWPIHAAEPYIAKTLKAVSELDLTSANAAFPINIRYGSACTAEGCEGGTVNGKACGTCHGTGRKPSPTSAMEEIVVTPPPSSPTEQLDLSKLFVYVSPPTDILIWQENYVKDLAAQARRAFLNSEIYDGREIAETATGKSIEQQNANDAVWLFFSAWAKAWENTVRWVAEIQGRRNLVAKITVGRDLKLRTVAELLQDLSSATAAQVGASARMSIEWDLMRAIYADDPDGFDWWEVRQRFDPFKGLTDEQKMAMAQSPFVPVEKKVLWANFGAIFEEISFEAPTFAKMPFDLQSAIVSAKVQEFAAKLPTANLDLGA